MATSHEEQPVIEEQKPRLRRFPRIILCEPPSSSTESSEESSEEIEIPKYVPTFKRKTAMPSIIPTMRPNTFKQEMTYILKWTGMDSYEVLAEDWLFRTERLMGILHNKNHIAIIVEDVEKNRYGGYINAFITDMGQPVADEHSFVFNLQIEGKRECEKYEIRDDEDENGFKYNEMAFIVPEFEKTHIVFQFGAGDIMVFEDRGKLWVSRIPKAYKYPAEVANQMESVEYTQVKRMYIVQFKGKRSEEYKIYVSNIPKELSNEIIRSSLENRLGKENVKEIHINKDAREMCAAYVSMRDQETAKQAIEVLNRHRIEGHLIRATWYYEDGPVAKYRKNNLYINMRDYKKRHTTEEEFLKFFKQYGEIQTARFCGSFGFVMYKDPEVVNVVLQLNGADTDELGRLEISRKR